MLEKEPWMHSARRLFLFFPPKFVAAHVVAQDESLVRKPAAG